jgi:2-isopropylmalate synthase
MRPQDVGVAATELVLGKHSGRHAVSKRARDLGFALDEAALTEAFTAFKERADDIGELDDEELRAIVTHGRRAETGWRLNRLETRVEGGVRARAVAMVELAYGDGELFNQVAIGGSALEAALFAVRQATVCQIEVDEIESLHTGFGADADATTEVWVRIGGKACRGRGRGPDPLWAGVRAILDAVNKATRPVAGEGLPAHEAADHRTAERHEAVS